MRFVDLYVGGFGKFHDLRLSFQPGINVIYGRNEAGKSSLHAFLRAMLFGLSDRPERGEAEPRWKRFFPWQDGTVYGGSLRFFFEGKIYRIERNFLRSPKDLAITNETDGSRVSDPEALLERSLEGLTESGYVNTISIGQLRAASDADMPAVLKRYIANLNTTGNAALSADAALSYLEKKKNGLSAMLQPEAAKDYARAVSSAKQLLEALSAPENDNLLPECMREQSAADQAVREHEEALRSVSEKLQKARAVLSENHFTDAASVEVFQEKTEALYADWQKLAKKNSRKWKPAACFFLFAAGLLLLLSGLFAPALSGTAPGVGLLQAAKLPFLAAGVLALLAASFLLLRLRSIQRQLSTLSAQLSETFRSHTGNEEVGEAARAAFRERMQGFLRLCEAAQSQEAERERILGELSALREKNVRQEALIREQQIRQSAVEEKLQELNCCRNRAAEFQRVIEEDRRLREEIDAISIAEATLKTLGTQIRNSVGTYLNREAGRLIDGITGGVYKSLDIGPQLDIRLNTKTRMVELGSVSSGTIDQVYLALRLAAVRLIEHAGAPRAQGDAAGKDGVFHKTENNAGHAAAGKKENGDAFLPLLFDDSFALYDDDRLSHALSFIAANCSGQVLLFSCHKREERLLAKNNTPYNMICLGEKTQYFAGTK